jgi:hypothetical protein
MTDREYKDEDLDRNENPERISGAVSSATSAGAVGAAGLVVLGPLGGVVGALAGAAGGWWLGKAFQRAIDDMDRDEQHFRDAHGDAGAGRPFDEVRHGYQLGYLAGRNPKYENARFSDVEPDLRAAWVYAHLQEPIPWEQVRNEAEKGYDIGRKKK